MNSPYAITQEEFDRLLNYLNGDDPDFLTTDIADKMNRITYDLNKKMRKDVLALRTANAHLNLRLETFKAKKKEELEKMAEEGSFPTCGLDSVDVGKAIVHCLRQLKMSVTREKVNLLLYQCYASRLGANGEILTIETPVAQSWGPQFWRMSKNFKEVVYKADGGWKTICEASPAVAAFIRNIVEKYSSYRPEDLQREYKNSAPYKNALKRKDEITNGEITPSDIYKWKRHQI